MMTRTDILRRDWPAIAMGALAIAVLWWVPPPPRQPVQWHIPVVPSFIPPEPAPPVVWFP
jgi:hypothetical protein